MNRGGGKMFKFSNDRLTLARQLPIITSMRGGASIVAALFFVAAPAHAADVSGPTTTAEASSVSAAPATPVWPGFEIRRTETLVALAWGRSPESSPSLAANTTAAACVELPIVAVAGDPVASRERYLPMIRAAECRHHLPRGLLASLIGAESAYNIRARSRVGAVGLTQLMPRTAIEMGVTDRFDPARSIEGGAKYLGHMIERFATVPLALAAYNAGPGAVTRAGGVPNNTETPAYVARVMLAWNASIPATKEMRSEAGLKQNANAIP